MTRSLVKQRTEMAVMLSACEGCGEKRLELVLDLGMSAPSCSMRRTSDVHGPEMVYPLALMRCEACGLVQLSCMVAPAVVFHTDYPYSSRNSGELRANFKQLALQVRQRVGVSPADLVVDIGANDGTLLNEFSGCHRVGVDPTDQILTVAGQEGLEVWQGFFSEAMARDIFVEHGAAKVITACNVLAHVAEIHDVLEGVSHLLAPGGMLVCENGDLNQTIARGQWDVVYHEHLRFFTPGTFRRLLEDHDLEVVHEELISTHGGSFRTWATRRQHILSTPSVLPDVDVDWHKVRTEAERTRHHLRSALSAVRAGDKRVAAIGATARASTIIGYCGLDRPDIEAVYEQAESDKLDHFMAGTSIPVRDESALFVPHAPDYLLLFAWHLADRIIPKLHPPGSRDSGYHGTVIVPLPHLKHVYRRKE